MGCGQEGEEGGGVGVLKAVPLVMRTNRPDMNYLWDQFAINSYRPGNDESFIKPQKRLGACRRTQLRGEH